MPKSRILNRQFILPQDHGAWVFILSPLMVGIFAGGRFTAGTLYLVIAAMMAFLLRQPMAMMVKSATGRRPADELPYARYWVMFYGIVAIYALMMLYNLGQGYIAYLAVPGLPVFAWHLWLVSKRAERRQAGIEIIATGVLSLAAPAAFWVGRGGYDPTGWWLWALTWAQSAASIVYAYLRLEQREKYARAGQAGGPGRSEKWMAGRRAFLYTSFNLAASILLGWRQLLPQWIFAPFLIQWLETLWGIEHHAGGWKPVRIGMRQLIVSTLWTVMFIIVWRL